MLYRRQRQTADLAGLFRQRPAGCSPARAAAGNCHHGFKAISSVLYSRPGSVTRAARGRLSRSRSAADPSGSPRWQPGGLEYRPEDGYPASADAGASRPDQWRQRMGTITTTDGTEIFYKDWGSGQPIVFSHGWPLSADDWDTQMMFFLLHGYRVIAHDRRGHGRSTQTD